MDENVLYAGIAVVGGITLGAVAGGLTRWLVLRGSRRDGSDSVASAAAGFVFWVAVAIGIAVAVGLLAPDALDPLPQQFLAYLPNVLVAGLLLIVGRAAATMASAVLGKGLARATGRTRREAAVGLRLAIMAIVIVLALSQLGVNTAILMILTAAVLFTAGTAMALLIGLGGREVARDVAAGRYLRRFLSTGTYVETSIQTGRIVALHAATTEFQGDPTGTIHVPNSMLLNDRIHIRSGPGEPQAPQGGPADPGPTSGHL
jgi:small-conductance mechanosensitive channel